MTRLVEIRKHRGVPRAAEFPGAWMIAKLVGAHPDHPECLARADGFRCDKLADETLLPDSGPAIMTVSELDGIEADAGRLHPAA